MAKTSSGGKAIHSGTDFQNRLAAWIGVRILAEQDAALPLDLPATVTLEWLRCETDQPVDVALVRSSAEGFLFVQAKHSVER